MSISGNSLRQGVSYFGQRLLELIYLKNIAEVSVSLQSPTSAGRRRRSLPLKVNDPGIATISHHPLLSAPRHR
jgi:hypothetical protein